MKYGKNAKSYDEILKITETVVNSKVAARATGQVKAQGSKSGNISVLSSINAAGKKVAKEQREI